jgi:undecaprenyl diphosphate synthase
VHNAGILILDRTLPTMPIHSSSTAVIPDTGPTPRHIAIIMDGNGRWAKRRFLPRVAGHRRGGEAVRATVRACAERGVEYLTLFAFSSENWRRPAEEVSVLKQLFHAALQDEVAKLHEVGIRLRVIGNVAPFGAKIADLVRRAEALTDGNRRMTLTIAANYGGRWDLLQAMNALVRARPERAGAFSEEDLAPYLALNYAPEPDLFIRTGGEQRISNFLLWQLAYTELYFTETLWPDFDAAALEAAIASYRQRERRFGRTSEQLPGAAPEQQRLAEERNRRREFA